MNEVRLLVARVDGIHGRIWFLHTTASALYLAGTGGESDAS